MWWLCWMRCRFATWRKYRALLDQLPHRALVCGFVAGEQELRCWDAAELLQFYFDTVPVYGTLDFLRPALTPHSARRAVLSGACGIYHACAHNYVHARSTKALQGAVQGGVIRAARAALL